MAITDSYNSGNNQTCSYTYDALGRLGVDANHPGVNCTYNSQNVWQQTFTYDQFGNTNKSGTSNWTVAYNTSTNRIQGWSYDGDGNLLSSGDHTYAYDAEGRPVTVDSVGLTYDAFGRAMEQNRSGAYTREFLYLPSGQKFAFMNGTTVQKYVVPLVAGMQAAYNGSGLQYYRHSDWLGSNALAPAPRAAPCTLTQPMLLLASVMRAGTTRPLLHRPGS